MTLDSVVDGAGKPILSLASIVKPPHVTPSGAEWYPNIQTIDGLGVSTAASRGAGVGGATVLARLLAGTTAATLLSTREPGVSKTALLAAPGSATTSSRKTTCPASSTATTTEPD